MKEGSGYLMDVTMVEVAAVGAAAALLGLTVAPAAGIALGLLGAFAAAVDLREEGWV